MELAMPHIADKLRHKKCLVGFDAFIDIIVKPIDTADENGARYFDSMGRFAEYIAANAYTSKSVETHMKVKKAGGNNPLLSETLARLGAQVGTIGAYGKGDTDPLFAPLASVARLYSVADPGFCISYEFDNSKLMTYTGLEKSDFSFDAIAEALGRDTFLRLIKDADLLAFVNYGEMPYVAGIWESALHCGIRTDKERIAFFDLSDISAVAEASLKDALLCIGRYGAMRRTVLSLNENEFLQICKKILGMHDETELFALLSARRPPESIEPILRSISRFIPHVNVVLRTLNRFYALDEQGNYHSVKNVRVNDPVVLTGAGDNQNAGMCAALLAGMGMEDVLAASVMCGHNYMSSGGVGG